ncbi:MAG TPA: AAA family ATPase [Chthonomonadaceae bacterium]|nr:AAA family ATPase [Chthonomonadaceae bacterium]
MGEHSFHQRLFLSNFTVFKDAAFEFTPGVNVFIGENGSGKTHLLKAIYAYQRPPSRDVPDLASTLMSLFQVENGDALIRTPSTRGGVARVRGQYGENEWSYALRRTVRESVLVQTARLEMGQPVFIPAMDMMGHTREFLEAYNQVYLDFDLTCRDIVTLFRLRSRNAVENNGPMEALVKVLGGDIEQDENGRFYLQSSTGRLPMPMVAEGLRKIASLVRLQRNGWLVPGSTLFWDEPETNINPILMDEVIAAILALSRKGVQVFLTTHSYVILKELDLQATTQDSVRYFSLQGSKGGTQITVADEFTALKPNPILQQYGSLYDRDLARAAGRSR